MEAHPWNSSTVRTQRPHKCTVVQKIKNIVGPLSSSMCFNLGTHFFLKHCVVLSKIQQTSKWNLCSVSYVQFHDPFSSQGTKYFCCVSVCFALRYEHGALKHWSQLCWEQTVNGQLLENALKVGQMKVE